MRASWTLHGAITAAAVAIAVGACQVASDSPDPAESRRTIVPDAVTTTSVSVPSTVPQPPSTGTVTDGSTVPEIYVPPSIPPIEGYGDFSSVPYTEIDWAEVTALVVQCLQDHGIPARVIPSGDGYELPPMPAEQAGMANVTADACEAGLHIPAYQRYSAEELAVLYEEMLATRDCLEELGYDLPAPPSKQAFVEGYYTDPWSPYASLPAVSATEWDRLQVECPQP